MVKLSDINTELSLGITVGLYNMVIIFLLLYVAVSIVTVMLQAMQGDFCEYTLPEVLSIIVKMMCLYVYI